MKSSGLLGQNYGKTLLPGFTCKLRQGQTRLCCKFAIVLSVIWITWYFLLADVSTYKSELIDQFRKEDMNIKNLQDKISQLLANGFGKQQENEMKNPIEPEILEPKKETAENLKYELDDGITEEAAGFIRELGLVNPGENGDPVELPKNLSEDIQKRIKHGFETHGYNAFVSSMVSLNRKLPDVRSDVCKKKVYTKNLPKCSILIPFHDDDWMLLMRTVHSVLNRAPLHLIEEIVLVDDASGREYLHEHLENYIKKYPLIRVVRSHRRIGIISNRMLGAVNAVGPVLVYIDSHVEVTEGFLEPILDRFAKDMNILVWPKMSYIDSKNLKVSVENDGPGSIGGFAWNMDFKWIDTKWYEGDHPTEVWEPKRSPTIIGGLYAISKSFFKHLGMFDPDFGIWGGEDVELSFKVWLCGGKIEYIPCSFVAHMYKGHTYTLLADKGYRWNTDRIAEVWLDEYKRYYYRLVGDTKDRNYGNISERIEIRNKLGCKPFKWYIDNVYPNVPIPENIRDPTTTTTAMPTTVTTEKPADKIDNSTAKA